MSDGDGDGLRKLFTYLLKSNVDPVRTRFRSHGVLRQQNSGGRQVARWLGSSGAPSEDHLLERHEDRAVRLTGTRGHRGHHVNHEFSSCFFLVGVFRVRILLINIGSEKSARGRVDRGQ